MATANCMSIWLPSSSCWSLVSKISQYTHNILHIISDSMLKFLLISHRSCWYMQSYMQKCKKLGAAGGLALFQCNLPWQTNKHSTVMIKIWNHFLLLVHFKIVGHKIHCFWSTVIVKSLLFLATELFCRYNHLANQSRYFKDNTVSMQCSQV
jgi:hypothetical protein